MVEDIYDPLEEYSNVYREKFKKVCEDTFAELAREANIDIEANRQTCQKVYDNEAFRRMAHFAGYFFVLDVQ